MTSLLGLMNVGAEWADSIGVISMFCRTAMPWLLFLVLGFVTTDLYSQPVSEPTSSPRYQKYLADFFDAVDTNKDGVIDAQEKQQNYRPILENADQDGDQLILKYTRP